VLYEALERVKKMSEFIIMSKSVMRGGRLLGILSLIGNIFNPPLFYSTFAGKPSSVSNQNYIKIIAQVILKK